MYGHIYGREHGYNHGYDHGRRWHVDPHATALAACSLTPAGQPFAGCYSSVHGAVLSAATRDGAVVVGDLAPRDLAPLDLAARSYAYTRGSVLAAAPDAVYAPAGTQTHHHHMGGLVGDLAVRSYARTRGSVLAVASENPVPFSGGTDVAVPGPAGTLNPTNGNNAGYASSPAGTLTPVTDYNFTGNVSRCYNAPLPAGTSYALEFGGVFPSSAAFQGSTFGVVQSDAQPVFNSTSSMEVITTSSCSVFAPKVPTVAGTNSFKYWFYVLTRNQDGSGTTPNLIGTITTVATSDGTGSVTGYDSQVFSTGYVFLKHNTNTFAFYAPAGVNSNTDPESVSAPVPGWSKGQG
jgi:hypothetical protein